VRPIRSGDINDVIRIYKDSFAEPPWNERWSSKQIIEDMIYALSSKRPIMLVAEVKEVMAGFIWGYELPLNKFPFLNGKIKDACIYLDDIAVNRLSRGFGVGARLLGHFLSEAKRGMFEEVVCRTDIRNKSSMSLFSSFGFSNLETYDPKFGYRPYFKKSLEDTPLFNSEKLIDDVEVYRKKLREGQLQIQNPSRR
jgi:ribosomal protein S18 acetylase RimI-like enzyme